MPLQTKIAFSGFEQKDLPEGRTWKSVLKETARDTEEQLLEKLEKHEIPKQIFITTIITFNE